jgi:glycosyltransferase involved in cell wall biosynthesis
MKVVHLTASTFFGGPERQILGLTQALLPDHDTLLLSFPEGGRCRRFLGEARRCGLNAVGLKADTPWFRASITEITDHLKQAEADLLFCHGYKAALLGRLAARRVGIPGVAVSRGWTGENLKVRLYEWLDRLHLRWMERVVCVSQAQASKVRRTGVREDRVIVIPNAVDPDRFSDPESQTRTRLLHLFREPPELIVGAAGRLSPEKGFEVLIRAAALLTETHPQASFVIFGEGRERQRLQKQIRALGQQGRVVLAGFRPDLDRFIPHFDILVLPSYTEGLPNVVLEASAAGVPVVGTRAGGTPEVIEDHVTGYLVPPGNAEALAERLGDLLNSEDDREDMGGRGRQRILEEFSFTAQADAYRDLIKELCPGNQVERTPREWTAPEPQQVPGRGEEVGPETEEQTEATCEL